MTVYEPAAFKRVTKLSLFITFFTAFIFIGFIPFLVVKYYTLNKVENEMRSSLNESYYLITERITDIIDRAHIRRWVSNLGHLRSSLDVSVVPNRDVRQSLLNTFMQNEPEMVVLSLKYPDTRVPLHFLKQDRLQELTQAEPDTVARFFHIRETGRNGKTDWIQMGDPVIFQCCRKAFLPVDVVFQWDDRQQACIRCVYDLTPALSLMDERLPLGKKRLYIVDRSGTVIFSSRRAEFRPNSRFDLPLMDKIKESLEGKARMFQLEVFPYQGTNWVGNFSTTRHLNWAVAVVEKEDTAYALVKDTRNQVVIWATVAFVLCVAVSTFFSWFFSLFIDRARNQLEAARDAAETANRAKSEFLANMSHEIRTPMNSILGFSDILGDKITNPTNQRYISLIRSSGKALLTLINDILDLSKIEAGKMNLEYTPVELIKLFEEIAGIFSPKIQEKGLRFIVEVDVDLPEFMLLDEIRLRQILLNLVGNAVKFTNTGHIRLAAERWGTDTDPNMVDLVIWVEDSGIGIPEDQVETIFGAFEQQKGQSAAAFGGTGLGLAITRRLLEMMGGTITALGKPDSGSLFTVRLPGVAMVQEPGMDTPEDKPVTQIAFKPATVLIADDVEENRILLKSFLEDYPFSFLEAEDGKQAIELARLHHPDLILLDMKMPVISGKLAVQTLKQEDDTNEIPIVAVTASTLSEEEEQIRSMSEGFLRKPLNRSQLVAELTDLLEHTVEETEPEDTKADQAEAEPEAHTISREQKENLNEMIHILDTAFMPRWEDIDDMLIMDELMRFSNELSECARQYENRELELFADELSRSAEAYDVEDVGKRVGEFPKIVEKIKGTMQ